MAYVIIVIIIIIIIIIILGYAIHLLSYLNL